MGAGSQKRHLIFLAHIWVCLPFLLIWLRMPEVIKALTEEEIQGLSILIWCVVGYLAVRTYIAIKRPEMLNWEKVYPPIDVGIVTGMLYFGEGNPLGNIALLYFLPIAEAAGTLNVRWAAFIASLSIIGSIFASLHSTNFELLPFNMTFRFFFLLLMSSLFTFLARMAAEIRSRLSVEADRNRIALEMHDGLQGSLITAASQLELAQLLTRSDPERAGQIAGDARSMIRQATDELRFLVQRMRTPEMAQGFEPALRQYASNICERNGIALTFDVEGVPRPLDAEGENALFRIAQESLNNVLRHSRASKVQIRLWFLPDRATLEIQDNGIGIPEGRTDGTGLESMKMRADDNGGTFELKAPQEGGTLIKVSMPVRRRGMRRSLPLPDSNAAVIGG